MTGSVRDKGYTARQSRSSNKADEHGQQSRVNGDGVVVFRLEEVMAEKALLVLLSAKVEAGHLGDKREWKGAPRELR